MRATGGSDIAPGTGRTWPARRWCCIAAAIPPMQTVVDSSRGVASIRRAIRPALASCAPLSSPELAQATPPRLRFRRANPARQQLRSPDCSPRATPSWDGARSAAPEGRHEHEVAGEQAAQHATRRRYTLPVRRNLLTPGPVPDELPPTRRRPGARHGTPAAAIRDIPRSTGTAGTGCSWTSNRFGLASPDDRQCEVRAARATAVRRHRPPTSVTTWERPCSRTRSGSLRCSEFF
jgi:hypothetical protein